jgi:VWFA-related protein
VEARRPERVELAVSVLDEKGEPVTGLGEKDFEVREGGAVRPLADFARMGDRQDRPLSAVLLVDRSTSMIRRFPGWEEAGRALLTSLRPIDEVALAAFASDVKVLVDFTADPNTILVPLESLPPPSPGTMLFRAIDETLGHLRVRRGRKVLFLLTDGEDDVRADVPSVSEDSYLRQLLRKAVADDVTIVTILSGPTSRPYLAVQDLAVQTGGWWLYPGDDLPSLVGRLGRRLLESYHLAFDSTVPAADRRKRKIEVRVTRPEASGWQVRTVGGVFGASALVDLVLEDLGDDDEARRAESASALAVISHPKASLALRRALKDDSARVRRAAAEAIGRRGDTALAGRLGKLLGDSDPAVRESALRALQALLRTARTEAERARVLDALEEEAER